MPNNASEIRALDQLGRVVIPKFVRNQLNLSEDSKVEIRIEDERIIIEPYKDSCIFCGATEDLVSYKEKTVCAGCRRALSQLK